MVHKFERVSNRMAHPSSWWSLSLNGSPHLRDPGGRGIHSRTCIDASPLTSHSLQGGLCGRGWTGILNRKVVLVARSRCRVCRAHRALAETWEDDETQSVETWVAQRTSSQTRHKRILVFGPKVSSVFLSSWE